MKNSKQIYRSENNEKVNRVRITDQTPNFNEPSTIGQTLALMRYSSNSKKRSYCHTHLVELWIPLAVLFTTYVFVIIEALDSGKLAILAHQITSSTLSEPALKYLVALVLQCPFIIYSETCARLLMEEREIRLLMQSMGLKKFTYYVGFSFSMLCHLIPVSLLFGIAFIIFANATVAISLVEFPLFFIIYPIQITSMIFASASMLHSRTMSHEGMSFFTIFLMIPHEVFVWACNCTNEKFKFIPMIFAHLSPMEATHQVIYGLSYSNETEIFRSDCSYYNYPPTTVVLSLMILWSVIYYSFAWYIDEICPWQTVRSPKSPLYCLKRRNKRLAASDSENATSIIKDPYEGYCPKYFEKAPRSKLGIHIDNVTKRYASSAAVDTLSFSIYSGQTTLLLGHNGAGKTTLMNMIVGNLAPDDGRLYIDGFDIDTCSEEARSSLGLCPQQSILSDKLTLDEHLDLFAGIKSGYSGVMKQQHIDMIVRDLNLEEHRDKMCSELSGGMKRKLSLALALVGDSKVLILDEPSSGLDPESRRRFWDSIRQFRSRRTVLLSTQHMEEADYLGDRIAIMSAGKIVCCGSSLFLKKSLGSAYKLRIECHRESRKTILATITKHFPKAKSDTEQSRSSHIKDMTIELIADADRQDDQLIGMFEEIEIRKDNLGIKSFGLKCSTIEDVFLNSAKIFADDALRSEADTLLGMETFASNLVSIGCPEEGTTNTSSLNLYVAFMKKQLIVLYRDLCSVTGLVRYFVLTIMIWSFLAKVLVEASTCVPQTSSTGKFLLSVILLSISFFAFSEIPTEERANKFKIMQLCSKACYFSYWTSKLLVDMPFILLYFLIFISSLDIFMSEEQILIFGSRLELYGSMLVLMVPYGLTSLLTIYLLSTCFDSKYLFVFITLMPAYTFRSTLQKFTDASFETADCKIDNKSHLKNGSYHIIFIGAIILLAQALMIAIMLYIVETRRIDLFKFFKCSTHFINNQPSGKDSLDEDVKIEERRAQEIFSDPSIRTKHAMISRDLTKSYTRSIRAVDGLTFAVDKSECFGLLGVNGAGKSTAFSMLSGDIIPDHGSIVCNDIQLSDDVDAYSENIGFDPQASPRTAYLTTREAMHFMARLRGMEESRIVTVVDAYLKILNMQKHANKFFDELSGGTKRKFSLALAIIGSPPVLLLDEPTAGIDPVARRGIWLTLSTLKSRLNTSIIISSHAMEECEAICDRLTIMVNGRMRCIGSFQHLRSKFGQGYMVRMQLDVSSGVFIDQKRIVSSIKEYLSENLKSLVTIDNFCADSVLFKVHNGNILRSVIFKVLRNAKHAHGNISYLVSDIGLEDIFLSLAREQKKSAI